MAPRATQALDPGGSMRKTTMAGIAAALWLAAVPWALAAGSDKAETKPTPASGEMKNEKPAPDAKGVKAAGPRLRMAEHHGKNPGKDRDMRHCLDLPTDKEIIRCSEQK
jgi:hypothetical protein